MPSALKRRNKSECQIVVVNCLWKKTWQLCTVFFSCYLCSSAKVILQEKVDDCGRKKKVVGLHEKSRESAADDVARSFLQIHLADDDGSDEMLSDHLSTQSIEEISNMHHCCMMLQAKDSHGDDSILTIGRRTCWCCVISVLSAKMLLNCKIVFSWIHMEIYWCSLQHWKLIAQYHSSVCAGVCVLLSLRHGSE